VWCQITLELISHDSKRDVTYQQYTLIEEPPPPGGGFFVGWFPGGGKFFVGWFPNQKLMCISRARRKKTPPEKQPEFFQGIGVVFQGVSSSSGFLVWKPPNKETPPGGGDLTMDLTMDLTIILQSSV